MQSFTIAQESGVRARRASRRDLLGADGLGATALRDPAAEGPAARFGRSLAVVVGIDAYGEGIAPLRSAVADAKAIAGALQRDHGFEVWPMYDDAARLPALLGLLRERLPAALGPDDRLLLYYAGHGIALDGDAGPAGYLVPAHARRADRDSFLPMQILHDELARLPVRHALVVLDCCFAGTFRWSSLRDAEPAAGRLYQERYDRYLASPAWQVLTSASGDQLALDMLANDRGEGDGNHSPFALALLDGLAGAADYTGDHLITADELALLVRERVAPAAAAAGHRQVPQLFPLGRHDGGQFVFQVPNRPLALCPAPPLDEDANPYRGLHSYRTQDRALFFGRDAVTARLIDAVTAQPLTVVVGPSGCGKSSLVQAGLAPALAEAGWTVLPAQRPGRTPLAALDACTRALGAAPSRRDPVAAWAAAVAARTAAEPDRPWLVVVDQLEELFTHRVREDERAAFLGALAAALAAAPGLRVVVTVRADAEPQLHATALAPWWGVARFTVPAMTRAELRQVIEQPAAAAVLHFETSRLVDRLIDDVALVPAPLPLLSFALSELYRRCWKRWQAGSRERALRETDYDEMGSVARALTQRATALLEQLVAEDPEYAVTVRNVLLRMVARVGGELARRRVPCEELVYGDPAEARRVAEVLQRFHDARLISLGTEETGPDGASAYVEPIHDELVRGWPMVSQWIEELEAVAGTRTLIGTMTDAVRSWCASGRDRSYLWPDRRVENLAALGKSRLFVFNAAEAQFVESSVRRRHTRRVRLKRRLIAVITVLAAACLVALWQWSVARANAEQATASAERANQLLARVQAEATKSKNLLANAARSYQDTGRDLLLKERVPEAVPYLIEARKIGPGGAALQMMFAAAARDLPAALFEHQGDVSSVGVSPDGTRVVTASLDKTARVWDPATGKPMSPPLVHHGPVVSAAFGPDRRRVITASEDHTAQIWDVPTGISLARLQHEAPVLSAAFSPDGTRAVTASLDKTARIWDAATGKALFVLAHRDTVVRAAFSPDGTRVVTASWDRTAQIWNAATGQLLASLRHEDIVHGAAFGPDGTRVVTASGHRATVWDAATGQLLAALPLEGTVTGAAFSPDGTRVVTASDDGTARVWDSATGKPAGPALQHLEAVTTAAFSPDGRRILTTSTDRTARVWDAATGSSVSSPFRHEDAVAGGVFSPDGQYIVTASADNTARLWQVTSGKLTESSILTRKYKAAPEQLLYQRLRSVGLSADGKRVVTASPDGTASIWDVATGELLATLHQLEGPLVVGAVDRGGKRAPVTNAARTASIWDTIEGLLKDSLSSRAVVSRAAFSTDGKRVVTTSAGGTASIWDVTTGGLLTTLHLHGSPVSIAALSSDGKLVLTVSADETGRPLGTVHVWDAVTGESLSTLPPRGEVQSAMFSPDGTSVITTSDERAEIWGIGPDGAWLRGGLPHKAPVVSTVFSADGALVVTTSQDRTARVWDARTGDPVTRPLQHEDTVVNAAFSPDGARVVTASTDTYAVVWDASTGKRLAALKHDGAVRSARFGHDGTCIVTASANTLQIWDATTGKLVRSSLAYREPVREATFSPDGTSVITTSDEQSVRVWETPLDLQSLAVWISIAKRSPYVLVDGVAQPRSSVVDGGAR